LLAGTALANGLVMVTANRSEFDRVIGLAVEDWTNADWPNAEAAEAAATDPGRRHDRPLRAPDTPPPRRRPDDELDGSLFQNALWTDACKEYWMHSCSFGYSRQRPALHQCVVARDARKLFRR
jgi:hypothetical protein